MKSLAAAIMLFTFAMGASAVPMLSDIQTGASALEDTGDSVFQIIDTDGDLDTITSFVIDRNAGFTNDFGFYDTADSSNRLSIFSGIDLALTAATIEWDGSAYEVIGGAIATFLSGPQFGVYSVNSGGNTWFSQSALNADGLDHWLTFETLGATPGILGVMNLTFALDDQFGGGDQDFNDLVVGCIDCVPFGTTTTKIPNPTPLALMGFGLLFMRHQLRS